MADLFTIRADGRDLEVLASGPVGGRALAYHGGTPTAAVEFAMLADAAAGHGWQFIAYSRRGYAAFTFSTGSHRRRLGR